MAFEKNIGHDSNRNPLILMVPRDRIAITLPHSINLLLFQTLKLSFHPCYTPSLCKSFVTKWPRKSSLKLDDVKTYCPLPSPQFPASLSPVAPDNPTSAFLIRELPDQQGADGHTVHHRNIQSIRKPDPNGGLRSEAAGPVNSGGHGPESLR